MMKSKCVLAILLALGLNGHSRADVTLNVFKGEIDLGNNKTGNPLRKDVFNFRITVLAPEFPTRSTNHSTELIVLQGDPDDSRDDEYVCETFVSYPKVKVKYELLNSDGDQLEAKEQIFDSRIGHRFQVPAKDENVKCSDVFTPGKVTLNDQRIQGESLRIKLRDGATLVMSPFSDGVSVDAELAHDDKDPKKSILKSLKINEKKRQLYWGIYYNKEGNKFDAYNFVNLISN